MPISLRSESNKISKQDPSTPAFSLNESKYITKLRNQVEATDMV